MKYFNDKLLICRTDSSYVFESVEGLSIHLHKIDLKRRISYIPTPKWLETKKATINPKNMNDMKYEKYFVYAATIVIYHKGIGHHPERISNKLLKYASKLDWNQIDFPAFTSDYKIFEKNNKDITLNILYVPYEEEEEIIEVLPEYISNHNFTRKKQIALLKISNGER